jgi:hypothetical protein
MRCTIEQLNEARAAKNERRCRGEQVGGKWKPADRGPQADPFDGLDELEAAIAEIVQSLATERQNEDEMLSLFMQENAEHARGEVWQEIPF